MALFTVGQKVRRIEDREVTGATVLSIQESTDERYGPVYELEYDEGGTGWWPESTIEAVE